MLEKLDALKLLQDTYLKVWAIYITWFNWFFGANLLAFSWILTSGPDKLKQQYLPSFVFFLLALVVIGIGVCIGMDLYGRAVRKKALELMMAEPRESEAINLIFGTPVAGLAPYTSIACHVTAGIVWLYVLFLKA